MASTGPLIACVSLGLAVFAISTLSMDNTTHWLPPWLLLPLLRLRVMGVVGHNPQIIDHAADKPEEVLVQQLKQVDVSKDPERARKLHSAIGNMLRTSGSPNHQAVSHFESARDAAKQSKDPDMILASHLELAEVYVEEGRPLESQRELAAASGVVANHFSEQVVKLNRGRGRAKFELGATDSALQYFEDAERDALQPEDVVLVACDISMVRTCLGQASTSLKSLHHALEVLHSARKEGPDGGMTAASYSSLSAEVHFRLAEALHSMESFDMAKAHYEKALLLQRKVSTFRSERVAAIKAGLKNIDRGILPELRCPRRPQAPWDVPKNLPSAKDPKFMQEILYLMEDQKFSTAEAKLEMALKAFSRPYRTLEASTLLNMLGNVHLEQSQVGTASRKFRQAIQAAMVCCGADNPEAQTAYEGLKLAKSQLPEGPDRQRTELWIKHYSEVATERKTTQVAAGKTDKEITSYADDAEVQAAYINEMEVGHEQTSRTAADDVAWTGANSEDKPLKGAGNEKTGDFNPNTDTRAEQHIVDVF